MAFTYGGDPSVSTLAAVRFLVGDTDSTDPLMADAEINYITATYSNVYRAAAEICTAIATKFSRQADTNNIGLSVSASQRAKAYLTMAKEFRQKANQGVEFYVGGRVIDELDTLHEDDSVKQPAFETDQFDYETNTDNNDED